MRSIEIIAIVMSVLIVGGVIAREIIKRKQGKSCSCDCSKCKMNCQKRKDKK